jgi:hypothetical protein
VVQALRRELGEMASRTSEMAVDMQLQKEVTRSLDAAVWSLGKTSLRDAFGEHGSDSRRRD